VLCRGFDDLRTIAEFGAPDDFGQEIFSLQLSPCFNGGDDQVEHYQPRASSATASGKRTRAFAELQSHYLFEDRFGRPGKGNDKGKVEGLVGYARRNFLVPIPVFESFEALNAYLLECCRQRMADSDKQGAWQSALNFRCEEE
jgi:hypothetical protein